MTVPTLSSALVGRSGLAGGGARAHGLSGVDVARAAGLSDVTVSGCRVPHTRTDTASVWSRVADPHRAPGQPGDLPAVDATVPDRRADRRDRARLRARPGGPARPRGLPAQVRAGQGRAARAGRAAGDRHRQRLRHRARLPHRPPRVRPARHPARAGRGRRRGHRRPALAARRPGRRRVVRPGQAARRRRRRRPAGHPRRGAGGHRRPGVRAADRRRPRPARGHLRLPGARGRRARRTRRLQPWGVVCWRGRWYVVGHDLDRGAARCFRLSRIVGAVRPRRPARRVHAAGRAST